MVRSILCEENDWPDVVVPNLKADDSGYIAPTFAEVVRMETSVAATGLPEKCLFKSLVRFWNCMVLVPWLALLF